MHSTSNSPLILLLEDDVNFGYILSEYLQLQGFYIDWVQSAEAALEQLLIQQYQLAILDIMLPGMNGFELAEQLKQTYPTLPFIFLSAKTLKVDQLKGYRLGAFDYITKPVDEELLVAKMRAILANQKSDSTTPLGGKIGHYQFYPQSYELEFAGERIRLTARETELLQLLYQYQNQLLDRRQALLQIWGATDEFSRKSMDVFISKLRKYLAKDPAVRIENVHGKGFILRVK